MRAERAGLENTGLKKAGDKYVHGYFDHLLPEPEKSMVNKFDKPVMIGGKVGKRVCHLYWRNFQIEQQKQ
jgi:hypothetical protein